MNKHHNPGGIVANNSVSQRLTNSLPKCNDNNNSYNPIPSDAVRPGGKYDVQGFIWNSTCKTYLKVFVSHVYSPDLFYFQLIENENLLAALMAQMQAFYDGDRGTGYKMIPDDVVVGLPVAARFRSGQKNVWHRGLILGPVVDSVNVEIFYVDYGTKDKVNLDNVRMLRKKYLSHYSQAIRGRLACVQPPDLETSMYSNSTLVGCKLNISSTLFKEWSQRVLDIMLEFVTDRPLICEVIGVEENSFSVNLCDTSKPNVDIYLNDLLIDQNLAERAPAPYPTVISLTQDCYV